MSSFTISSVPNEFVRTYLNCRVPLLHNPIDMRPLVLHPYFTITSLLLHCYFTATLLELCHFFPTGSYPFHFSSVPNRLRTTGFLILYLINLLWRIYMTLTNDELITALHCCNDGRTGCTSCPLCGLRTHDCLSVLHSHAINALVDSTALVCRIKAMLDDVNDSVDAIRSICP